MTSISAFTWLVHGVLASTILLSLATLAVAYLRQPADRLRLIQWSLAGTLCALVLVSMPQLSAYSLGLLNTEPTLAAPPATATSAVPEAAACAFFPRAAGPRGHSNECRSNRHSDPCNSAASDGAGWPWFAAKRAGKRASRGPHPLPATGR